MSVAVEADRDEDVMGLMVRGMPKAVASDFANVYELLLVHGVPVCEAKARVCELFSPPRVTAMARRLPRLGSTAGSTFDLFEDANGVAWDFRRAEDRRRARSIIEQEEPYLVIGSPSMHPL